MHVSETRIRCVIIPVPLDRNVMNLNDAQQNLYSLHIFKHQCPVFSYKWYIDKRHEKNESENHLNCISQKQISLMLGLLFSIKTFCKKISPEEQSSTSIVTSSSFHSFSTSLYKLHYFESLTGCKFVLITKPGLPDMCDFLKTVYKDIYVGKILRCMNEASVSENAAFFFSVELENFIQQSRYSKLLETKNGLLSLYHCETKM